MFSRNCIGILSVWVSCFFAVMNYLNNRYLIWRHGESYANKQGIIISALKNGERKCGLTEEGADQVRNSTGLAKQLGVGSDAIIYTSPFLRCAETAEIITRELH